MAIKNILVHQDQTKSCVTRLKLAVDLAKKHDAHLKVIFARGGWRESIQESAEEAKIEYKNWVQSQVSSEWIEADAYDPELNLVDQLLWHARHSDLIILGQYNEDDHGYAPKNLAEQLVLEAGRPLLLVPHSWKLSDIGKRIMVAWDRKRESTRAVNDSIPFLKQAKVVELVAVTSKVPDKSKKFDRCKDLAIHLEFHGIKAKTNNLLARDIDILNLLLSAITDGDIDMAVMGAYGHARIREMVLGGVTKEIFSQLPVPVLMSH